MWKARKIYFNKKKKWSITVRGFKRSKFGPPPTPPWRYGPLGHYACSLRRRICWFYDRRARRPGKRNSHVPQSDIRPCILEYKPSRSGGKIRRDIQTDRCKVRG
ncbi:hypothetical protein KQX54_020089 [Cotesia glomerata]|uniref:Uncharacterized protein n=1 Tax=Cotesia glomerata TaxID=32391 RepID=A0AAV7IZN5_COTGL|nr:hypothetical protein KQX54_018715 [Cotesia glomerata]KAH0561916.1 hypothetical protein KQX54_020089 [Cotesia glomerata]